MTVDPGASGTPMSERMQSLLSRAVEDQLSEQRQLAGVLTEMRAQLTRIGQDLEGLRTAATGSAQSGEAVGDVSAAVREAVRLLAERLDGVARLVQERGSDLAEVKASVNELQAAVRAHGDALTGVSGGLAALPAFGDRIGGLQDNLVTLHQRLEAVNDVAQAVASLQQHVDAVGQDLRELRSAFTGIASRVAEVPGRGDLNAAATRMTERVDEVGERLARIEPVVSQLVLRLDQLAGQAPADGDHALEGLRAELARFAETVIADAERSGQRLDRLDQRLSDLSELLEAGPEPAAEAVGEDEDEEETEDPILVELDDLREALLGPGGLADKVDALDTGAVDARVTAAVSAEVTAAEDRLTAHIDEAVLALAEALLRRRGGRSAPAAPMPSAAPAVPTSADDAAEAVADETPDETAGEIADEPAPAATAPEEVADVAAADDAAVDADDESATPVAQAPEPAEERAPDEPGRRKRPWWRPGD